MGRGSVIGEAMVQNRGIAAISFTGSVGVGSRIAQSAVKSFKKVQLEMGGKNPQVVLDDADSAQAVELSVQSAFYSTGQRCTASSRLIVTEGIYPRFVQAMTERMARIKVGDALAAGTDIGPVSSQTQLEQDLDYVAIAKAEGAVLAAGGERLRADTERYFMSPALFSESTPDMRISREEVFGPVANILRAKNYEEALALANDAEFGLSAGIATTSLKLATHFKLQAALAGWHGHGEPADRRRRLPRALRRPKGIELRAARAGTIRGGVLHRHQDGLHAGVNMLPHLRVS
jgi:acyl-CoA reductase-like NAD-dependent aldehyde dehydrogenase